MEKKGVGVEGRAGGRAPLDADFGFLTHSHSPPLPRSGPGWPREDRAEAAAAAATGGAPAAGQGRSCAGAQIGCPDPAAGAGAGCAGRGGGRRRWRKVLVAAREG